MAILLLLLLWLINCDFCICVEGYPRKLLVKFHCIWPSSYRYSFKQNMLLLLVNKDALLYFCGGSPKETSWQVSLNLTQLFQRRCFVSNGWRTDWLAYAWTDDRQRPIRIPHFEYRAQVSLKQVIAYVTININKIASYHQWYGLYRGNNSDIKRKLSWRYGHTTC